MWRSVPMLRHHRKRLVESKDMKFFQKIVKCSHCGYEYDYDAEDWVLVYRDFYNKREFKEIPKMGFCPICNRFTLVSARNVCSCGHCAVYKNVNKKIWVCKHCRKGILYEDRKIKIRFKKKKYYRNITGRKIDAIEELIMIHNCLDDLIFSEKKFVGFISEGLKRYYELERYALIFSISQVDDVVINKLIIQNRHTFQDIANPEKYLKESIDYYNSVFEKNGYVGITTDVMKYLYCPGSRKTFEFDSSSAEFEMEYGYLKNRISYVLETILFTYYPYAISYNREERKLQYKKNKMYQEFCSITDTVYYKLKK